MIVLSSASRFVVASLLCALAGVSVAAEPLSSAKISAEVARTIPREGSGVAQFWWLPVEYWMASARELGQSGEEIDTVRRIFQDYLLLGVVDVSIDDTGKAKASSIAEVVGRIEVYRNGEKLEVLRQVNPELVKRSPQLSYPLRAALAPMDTALRVLPLANVDPTGAPILGGASTGELRVVYHPPEGGDPVELLWHGPLTSVAGAKRCPKGGEPLEASWRFCPWHGVEVSPP